MDRETTPEFRDQIKPNGLAILAAMEVLCDRSGPSPKTDHVGAILGKNARWVISHSEKSNLETLGLATLSTNGHCWIRAAGRELTAKLRSAPPSVLPRPGCYSCGAAASGPCVGCRQMYACGAVSQWIPDRIPGRPRAEVAARSEASQHGGMWIGAARCLEYSRSYFSRTLREGAADSSIVGPGDPVTATRGSSASAFMKQAEGRVVHVAGARALVAWPRPTGGVLPSDFDQLPDEATIVDTMDLLPRGAIDLTGLTDAQSAAFETVASGDGRAWKDADDVSWCGEDGSGRKLPKATLAVLARHGLVEEAVRRREALLSAGPRRP